jgi:hypothetical protein
MRLPLPLGKSDNGYGARDRQMADALRAAKTSAEADQIARANGMTDASDAVSWLKERS